MTYDEMIANIDLAMEELEALRNEVDDLRDRDSSGPVDTEIAGTAVLALSGLFEVVKGLSEDGQPLFLPDGPLALPDAVLATILANAAAAQKRMERDVDWLTAITERFEKREGS